MNITILGIESSCDDTSASVIRDGYLLSNVIANQEIHKIYGGVVPELASRDHQRNIIPVVDRAINLSGISKYDISAIAYTRGPGLMGSLLVGSSFAKGLSLSLSLPLIDINHLQAHILSNFILESNITNNVPSFPFLCLLVSGGHTQLVLVSDHLEMKIVGQTLDDAAGEAFDKCAKNIGLPFPGGPVIDKLAKEGSPVYSFSRPRMSGYNYSFSGLKTSFLYFIRDKLKVSSTFIDENINDLCASLQKAIIEVLMDKLILASEELGIKEIALAGGVSANSGLRTAVLQESKIRGWNCYIPAIKFTTDNAAMVAITGYYKYKQNNFATHGLTPFAKLSL